MNFPHMSYGSTSYGILFRHSLSELSTCRKCRPNFGLDWFLPWEIVFCIFSGAAVSVCCQQKIRSAFGSHEHEKTSYQTPTGRVDMFDSVLQTSFNLESMIQFRTTIVLDICFPSTYPRHHTIYPYSHLPVCACIPGLLVHEISRVRRIPCTPTVTFQ